jgi:sugar lactone lactonase YvrE
MIDAAPCVMDCTPGPLTDGLSTLAGWSQNAAIDGPRDVARFDDPVNVVVGKDGTVYVADYNNFRIRAVTPTGDVSTLVQQANFQRPFGLALSVDGTTLYAQTDRNEMGVQDPTSGTIWRIDIATGVATAVGHGLQRPRGLAVLADGRVVLSDHVRHTLQLLDPTTGAVQDLAGTPNTPGLMNGTGTGALFAQPYDVVVDGSGDLLVADFDNNEIRKVTLGGAVTTFAGTGAPGAMNGARLTATFSHPQGLAIDGAGNVYVTDTGNHLIRRIAAADGQVTTIAANGTAGFHDDPMPLLGELYALEGVDVNADASYLYIADGDHGDVQPYHRVRRLTLP